MTMLDRLIIAAVCLAAGMAMAREPVPFVVLARDVGQIPADTPPSTREWFKTLRNPGGYLCCDIADGHRTTWRGTADGSYEVQIDGEWWPVPRETVITSAGNPVHEAVVWYYRPWGKDDPIIRCFVPGDGV